MRTPVLHDGINHPKHLRTMPSLNHAGMNMRNIIFLQKDA
jgi:hypothetical protein